MRELSLHVLDLIQNSIEAGAREVEVSVSEDEGADLLTIEISDDGSGIPEDALAAVTDPFYTSRTTRRVGLGLPLFLQAARGAGGDLTVSSRPGSGTKVTATFKLSHIDRAPLGDMAETIALVVACNPDVKFRYCHTRGCTRFSLDSDEFRRGLGGGDLAGPALAQHLMAFMRSGLASVQRA